MHIVHSVARSPCRMMFGNLVISSISMSWRFCGVGSRKGLGCKLPIRRVVWFPDEPGSTRDVPPPSTYSVSGRFSRTKSLGLWLDPYDAGCSVALSTGRGARGVTGTDLGAMSLQSLVRLVDRWVGLGTDPAFDSVRLRLLFRDPVSSTISRVVPLSSA